MDYQGFIGRGGKRGKLLPPPPNTTASPSNRREERGGKRERERWGEGGREGGRDVEPEGSNNIIIIRWGC